MPDTGQRATPQQENAPNPVEQTEEQTDNTKDKSAEDQLTSPTDNISLPAGEINTDNSFGRGGSIEQQLTHHDGHSPDCNEKLFTAASDGNYNAAKDALDGGADLSARDECGQTALHLACWYDHEEVADLLLRNKADVEAQDTAGWTPLHSAAYRASKKVLRLLLDHQPEPNIDAQSSAGFTPLMYASWHIKDEAVIQALLEKKPDINLVNSHGSTALTLACEISTAEIVRMLLDAGADVGAQDNDGDTPLILAAKCGDAKMVYNVLSHNPDIQMTTAGGATALHQAMENEKNEERNGIIHILLEKGSNPMTIDANKQTPLHLASKKGYLDLVKLLLEHNQGSVDTQDNDGYTALHLACLNGHIQVATALLSKGAKSKVGVGESAQSACVLFVGFLFGNLTTTSGSEWPFSCTEGNTRLLLSHADAEERLSALDVALSTNYFDLLGQIMGMSPIQMKQNKAILLAKSFKEAELIELLEESVTDFDHQPTTALQWAAYHGHYHVVWWLQRNTAPSKDANRDRDIALLIAKKRREEVETHTDFELKGHHGKTSMLIEGIRRDIEEVNGSPTSGPISQIGKVSSLIEKIRRDIEEVNGSAALELKGRTGKTSLLLERNRGLDWAKVGVALDVLGRNGQTGKTFMMIERMWREIEEANSSAALRSKSKIVKASLFMEKMSREWTDDRVAPGSQFQIRDIKMTGYDAKSGTSPEMFRLTVDLLIDPPPVQATPLDAYKKRTLAPDLKRELRRHWVTIVDFYDGDGRVGLLRRSRSVYDVIYKETGKTDDDSSTDTNDKIGGPEDIMQEARTTLSNISPEAAERKKFERSRLKMRWIHLPANNMEWMEDLANRVYKDNKTEQSDWEL